MSIKPWICNGSRTIVKDRWIDLHADDCALPDGTKISCASTAMERDRSF